MAKAKSAGQSRSDLRARLYDWECVHVLGRTDQDVGFWLEVAKAAPGPCLELACGTGRVSVPLAAAGIDIVGLDYDVMMLTVAAQRERRQRSQVREQRPQPTQQAGARFITSDMRRFALHRQFGAVLIPTTASSSSPTRLTNAPAFGSQPLTWLKAGWSVSR
jgi:hypothetical protein